MPVEPQLCCLLSPDWGCCQCYEMRCYTCHRKEYEENGAGRCPALFGSNGQAGPRYNHCWDPR